MSTINVSFGSAVTIVVSFVTDMSNIKTYTGSSTLTPVDGVATLTHSKGKIARVAFFIGANGAEHPQWIPTPGDETNSINVDINEAVTYTVNLICF